MKKILLSAMFVLAFNFTYANGLDICTDKNYWYPFTYSEKGVSKGLHIDIVKETCKRLGFKCQFMPLPWKRCLHYGKNGKMDAVVSASYKDERNEYLYYPPNAKSDKKSKWRITQAEYSVITHKNNKYLFEGDVKSIPKPVRAPLGYSIVGDLEKKGITVYTFTSSKEMFKRLLRNGKGAIITSPMAAKAFASINSFTDKITVHPKSIVSKSYFMVFSRKSKLKKNDMETFWKKLVEVREDTEFFNKILTQY